MCFKFTFTLLVVCLYLLESYVNAYYYQKCCDSGSSLMTNSNSTVLCKKDANKRTQINMHSNESYLLNDSLFANFSVKECVDVNNKTITKYRLQQQKILHEEALQVNYFPKCCPLNYSYDSVSHSCTRPESHNNAKLKIPERFLKIGLPQCRVISDYALLNLTYRIEKGILHLEHEEYASGEYCLDMGEMGHLIARVCRKNTDICRSSKCLHKCCPDGQSFIGGRECKDSYEHGLNLSFTNRVLDPSGPFTIIHNYFCKIYMLKDHLIFYVNKSGDLIVFYNLTNSYKSFGVDDKSYCIEHVALNNSKHGVINKFQFFMCFEEVTIPTKLLVARWIKLASCVFIVLTMMVYLFLPEIRNLFGKILMCYCCATLALFSLLSYNQFDNNVSDRFCVISSFLTVFLSFSSFAWLNVMSFNIWWTFGKSKIVCSFRQKENDMKHFLLYCLYGWGLPICFTFLVYLMYAYKGTPYSIRPFLGQYKCFWENRSGNYAMFLYYIFPIAIIEIVDIVLFVKTIIYCIRVKKEIKNLNDNRIRENVVKFDREQLNLILKLSVIMGISYIFEVVSSIYVFQNHPVTKVIEIVWDAFNCSQGLFIFLIFVCKRRILTLCRQRLKIPNLLPARSQSLTTNTTELESLKRI